MFVKLPVGEGKELAPVPVPTMAVEFAETAGMVMDALPPVGKGRVLFDVTGIDADMVAFDEGRMKPDDPDRE